MHESCGRHCRHGLTGPGSDLLPIGPGLGVRPRQAGIPGQHNRRLLPGNGPGGLHRPAAYTGENPLFRRPAQGGQEPLNAKRVSKTGLRALGTAPFCHSKAANRPLVRGASG
mgnify:CR=1 FL=1